MLICARPLRGRFPAWSFLLCGSWFHRAVLPARAFCSTGVLRLRGTPGDQRREGGRRIQAPVDREPARLKPQDPFRLWYLRLEVPAGRTGLGGRIEAGGDHHPGPAPRGLILRSPPKLRPPGVRDGPRQVPIADHAAHREVFDHRQGYIPAVGRPANRRRENRAALFGPHAAEPRQGNRSRMELDAASRPEGIAPSIAAAEPGKPDPVALLAPTPEVAAGPVEVARRLLTATLGDAMGPALGLLRVAETMRFRRMRHGLAIVQ